MAFAEREMWVPAESEGEFLHHFPARTAPLPSTEELLARLRARAPDPTVFDSKPPFFARAEISSTRLDSYSTHMDDQTSLVNYAAEADVGVPFMNSHRTGGWFSDAEQPMGRTLTGRLYHKHGEHPARVEADFYTIPGVRLSDITTDDWIESIRSGIARDVSIGFDPGKYVCDLCGRDMLRDYACHHIPGWEYSKDDLEEEEAAGTGGERKKKEKEKVTCTACIVDSHLVEVSSVYAGACPQAIILKVQRMAAAGLLIPEQARFLEQRYRVRLPGVHHAWRLSPEPERAVKRGKEMGNSEELSVEARLEEATADLSRLTAERARVASVLTERGWDAAKPLKTATLDELVRDVADEALALRPEASDGRKYRESLIQEAKSEGVRALGETFDWGLYEPMLKSASIDAIQRLKDDWKAIGDKVFPGGRHSEEKARLEPAATTGRKPARAYTS